ncbi:MAG: serine/threonine protein kinase [bacterium]|nr:serine/threonine protein kinase [bacterium]
MSNQSWQQVWEVFEQAITRTPEERPAYLEEACGDDSKLRRAVEGMLAADQETESFLDQPLGHGGGGSPASPRAAVASGILPRGTMVGPYRVLRQIGQGGMSTVYLSERADDAFPRQVALKLVRPGMESASILRRLRTERLILASLDHPYIARLYDGGTSEEGMPYFVMEYVEGVQIDDYCDQNQLSVDERLALYGKVAEAVLYAHRNLVVHRDIKPSNILVMAGGDPKLLDFGIAKLLKPELMPAGVESTATWDRVLTPNYASPEQIRGKLITTASDVYSLGVLLYEILTGRLPHSFEGCSPREIESIITETEPLPPSAVITRELGDGQERETGSEVETLPYRRKRSEEIRRQLTGDLDAIVLKALRSAPQRRYASVEQLVADIERHQAALPVLARTGSWRYRAGKFARRNRQSLAVLTAIAALLLGFAVAMAIQADRVAFERDQARQERDKKAQVLSLVLEVFEYSSPFVVPGEQLTVHEALERSVPVLEDAVRDQPEIRAELLHTSGTILEQLAAYEAARSQLEEALEIREKLHGESHSEVVETMTSLARTYKDLGEFDRAEALVRRALATSRGLFEEGHPDLAEPLNELVSILCWRAMYDAAEEPAVEALAVLNEMPEGGKRRLAALENLAIIRNAHGDYAEGVRLNREAVSWLRQNLGGHHPSLVGLLNNLGSSLRRVGDLEAAEDAFSEAIDLQRENFSRDLPQLLNNLAAVRFDQGNYEGAEELYRGARAASVERSGPDHWTIYFFDLRIASTRTHQGAAEEAETFLRSLLEHWRPELGDHWRIDEGISILGESVSAQGRCEEAEVLLVESFEKLVERARHRTQSDALERLRVHFDRCGGEIAGFEAMMAEEGT